MIHPPLTSLIDNDKVMKVLKNRYGSLVKHYQELQELPVDEFSSTIDN